jgi:hypothetical protein
MRVSCSMQLVPEDESAEARRGDNVHGAVVVQIHG